MISIFPLETFHLYVPTFQQHMHVDYISLSFFTYATGMFNLVTEPSGMFNVLALIYL